MRLNLTFPPHEQVDVFRQLKRNAMNNKEVLLRQLYEDNRQQRATMLLRNVLIY